MIKQKFQQGRAFTIAHVVDLRREGPVDEQCLAPRQWMRPHNRVAREGKHLARIFDPTIRVTVAIHVFRRMYGRQFAQETLHRVRQGVKGRVHASEDCITTVCRQLMQLQYRAQRRLFIT